MPKPFLTSLSIGIPWIKLHTSFRVWSLSSLQLVSKMIENIWHNFTPTSETVNKDNDDKIFSSIFKYFFKSPKKCIICVCLNWIESMSLLWNYMSMAWHMEIISRFFWDEYMANPLTFSKLKKCNSFFTSGNSQNNIHENV